jgi:hypothetical protein
MLLSTALDVLYEKVQGLGRQKFWFLFLGAAFVLVILINGAGIIPEEPYQRLSQNPFITRTDIHFNNYWQETVLLPLLAYYLDLTGTITFNTLTFFIIVGAFSLFAWFTYRYRGSTLALLTTTLLITSPLTTILLSWLGTPDGLTLALTIPFLFTNSSILIFLLALLGTANHPSFLIAILEILILRWAVHNEISIKHILLAVLGIVSGYGLIKIFLYTQGTEVVSRLDFMQLRTLRDWVELNMNNLPGTLFSLFNIHWLILPLSMIMFFKKDRRFFVLAGMLLLLNYVIVFFTLDTTRVYSLLSWAVLFVCIFHSYDLAGPETENNTDYQKQYLQALILIGVISFFTPRFFSWVGEIHVVSFFKAIGQLTS